MKVLWEEKEINLQTMEHFSSITFVIIEWVVIELTSGKMSAHLCIFSHIINGCVSATFILVFRHVYFPFLPSCNPSYINLPQGMLCNFDMLWFSFSNVDFVTLAFCHGNYNWEDILRVLGKNVLITQLFLWWLLAY